MLPAAIWRRRAARRRQLVTSRLEQLAHIVTAVAQQLGPRQLGARCARHSCTNSSRLARKPTASRNSPWWCRRRTVGHRRGGCSTAAWARTCSQRGNSAPREEREAGVAADERAHLGRRQLADVVSHSSMLSTRAPASRRCSAQYASRTCWNPSQSTPCSSTMAAQVRSMAATVNRYAKPRSASLLLAPSGRIVLIGACRRPAG